jgi:hypothetical protein
VGLGEQATVEQHHRQQPRLALGLVELACEQFLRNAHPVVVREQVHLADAAEREQLLAQVGLLDQRVAVARRLGREAEAEQVRCEDVVEGLTQSGPDRLEVPGCRREAVNQQQGPRAGALALVEDRMAVELKTQAGIAPAGEAHAAAPWRAARRPALRLSWRRVKAWRPVR